MSQFYAYILPMRFDTVSAVLLLDPLESNYHI
jgi:hypothetical protein